MEKQKNSPKVLVVGGSGATGRLLVDQLLKLNHSVRIVVRNEASLPSILKDRDNLEIIEASLLDMSATELKAIIADCTAIASCLGHNLTWKGIYGHPRRLVTDAVQRLTDAVKETSPEKPVKYVLMNTTGNTNRDIEEKVPLSQRIVVGILRVVLPPQADNEDAADYLRLKIGQDNPHIEWVAVRPDGLIDTTEVSEYEVHTSPIRNPITNAGKTSRINVGNFMARLIAEQDLWKTWRGQMPVIYNNEYTMRS